MANVQAFRTLATNEAERLKIFCSYWREIIQNKTFSDNIEGDINCAVGQAELLMKERFVQFSHLIDDCEFGRGEKLTTCEDLQGFWDTVYFQIENINNQFQGLENLKNNNWQPLEIEKVKCIVPKIMIKKKLSPKLKPTIKHPQISNIKSHILAARQRMKQIKGIVENTSEKENVPISNSKTLSPSDNNENSKFEGGFFTVVTPVKSVKKSKAIGHLLSDKTPPRLLSSSALKQRMKATPPLHKDYSPCIRITRSMKRKGYPCSMPSL